MDTTKSQYFRPAKYSELRAFTDHAQPGQRDFGLLLEFQLILLTEACVPVVDHEDHVAFHKVKAFLQPLDESDEDTCRLNGGRLELERHDDVVRQGKEWRQPFLTDMSRRVEQYDGILLSQGCKLALDFVRVGDVQRMNVVLRFVLHVFVLVILPLALDGGLAVAVHHDDLLPFSHKIVGKEHTECRLAHTAFLVGECYDVVVVHVNCVLMRQR